MAVQSTGTALTSSNRSCRHLQKAPPHAAAQASGLHLVGLPVDLECLELHRSPLAGPQATPGLRHATQS